MSWGFIRLPDQRALVFSYVDPKAGPSAKGARFLGERPTAEEIVSAVTRPNVTVRLEKGLTPRTLNEEELEDLALPEAPEWLEFFRPPPPKSAPPVAVVVEGEPAPEVDTGTALRLALIVVAMLSALAFVAFELLN